LKKANFSFIDLFAGIGGFHLGLKKIGGKCVYVSEWDKYSATTYGTWYHNTAVDSRDIRKININRDIPKHDLLAGGFPCQPFSLAGVSKKNSMGLKHGFDDLKQGNLFVQICKIIKVHQPKVVFLENVKNLVSHDQGRTWMTIQTKLNNLDYEVYWKIIDASSWVPQHRERIYIVAFRRKSFTKKEMENFKFPKVRKQNPILRDVLDDKPIKKYMLTDNLWKYLVAYAEKHKSLGNGFGFTLANPKGQSRTLSARYYKDGSEILIKQKGWRNPRRISPGEAARLMGFDDSWGKKLGNGFPQVVSDTQAYRQFGNAVCPHVVQAIGSEIVQVLLARKVRISR
jgi:DNA (cytosine-5)-methyltransferase 1